MNDKEVMVRRSSVKQWLGWTCRSGSAEQWTRDRRRCPIYRASGLVQLLVSRTG